MEPRLDKAVLEQFDTEERYAAVFPDLIREELPHLVRHVDRLGREGTVLYSRVSAETVDAVAREQVQYFRGQGQGFEWKVFAHDTPPDLVDRLGSLGFDIDEREAVMVLDLESDRPLLPVAKDVSVRRVRGPTEIDDVVFIKERVWGRRDEWLLARLTLELTATPNYLSVYVAYVDDVAAATGWIRFPSRSAFASMWAGATLPEHRNRGLYTALLAARVGEARSRGYRYVYVDAGRMSRPILEKRGFGVLTYATACTWHG